MISAGGCSEEELPIISGQPVLVRLTDEETRIPVPGIKAVMMDPDRNLPVGGVQVSGADGICNFGNLRVGARRLVIFGRIDYRVHSLPDFQGKVSDRPTSGPLGDLTGPEKTAPVRVFEAQLHRIAPDSLPRITGLILDADTGTPLDEVFVSLSPYLTGYHGDTLPSDDITRSDGVFQVSQIFFAMNEVTGNLHQVLPLMFSKAGYRPLIWKYDPPNGSLNLDIRGILLAMEKSLPTDTASLSGRVVRSGVPVAGVPVGLGAVTLSGSAKGAAGAPGWAAVTDSEGRYSIGNLPAGSFVLHPGFLLADGAFFPAQPNNRAWQVAAGQEVEVPDLTVLYEIEFWSPSQGLTLGAPPDSLHWSPVAGTATYEAYLDGEVLPVTTTNAAGIPLDWVIAPGLHYWTVLARDSANEIIGVPQIRSSFRLHE